MKLYERDLPGEFSLKNNFSDSAYYKFLDKLEKDYPELVPYFKDEDDYGYGSWFYEKALNFYSENKGDIDFGNIDEFVKDFLETEGKYIIKNLNKEKENNDKLRAARKTGKVDGKKVWHWEYEDDPDDGTRHKFKADGINPVYGTYDGVYESTKLRIKEAKQILNESGYQLIDEALEGPATSKQLWTLFKLTKKDYRGQDLSKEDAFKMIGELLKNKENGSTENKETPVKKEPKTAKPKINDNPLVKVGDIFSFSFGYDMTINQYYKVLSTKGKKAQVVEIGKKWVSGDHGYTGEVVPVPEKEIDEPITALIKDDGNIRVKMFGRYHTAYPDSGKPSYENHMD